LAGPLIAASPAGGTAKTRAAALSIASNSLLIALKLTAGAITGSVAIITEAMHSSIDLIASVVAYVSVRTADKPADDDHPYGHEKIENLAAAIEAMLILVGSGVIVFESVRRLSSGIEVHSLGVGIAVIAFSMLANIVVSTVLARRARETDSPALEGDAAHLRTDAATSAAVLAGLLLVQITGALVDEALPPEELDAVREAIEAFGPRGVRGYHKLRARRAGSRRYVDMHVQFAAGTTLEAAHATAHQLQDAIRERLRSADVLIHLEPEASLHPGTELH
jgi:divalent metal cation (Fe/Co/Zn/Cd) transporter